MAASTRLHRALARAGVASRRASERLIEAGRVTINGVVARIGQSVDPAHDQVRVDHRAVDVREQRPQWFVLHKPPGVLTTKRDPGGRRTVFELLPDIPGLTYVGRLDMLTEGVLLLTTDGDAAHRLTHPRYGVERVYEATVRGPVKAAADQARQGVTLQDGVVHPTHVEVRALGGRRWLFEVTLREGRHHEVRRLCEALGLDVERLVRTRYGPIGIEGLAPAQARKLTRREEERLAAVTEEAASRPGTSRSRPGVRASTGQPRRREGRHSAKPR